MSYYQCTNCHHEADIFGHGGGEALATELNVPFLGRLPIYQPIREGSDSGHSAGYRGTRIGSGQSVSDAGGTCRGAGVYRRPQDRRSQSRKDSAHSGSVRRSPSVTSPTLPFTKHTLANGLDVIVHEAHQVPIVAVNVWYHVGSKNERPGRTGFAHLFEHLMFEGSEHHPGGYFPPLQQAGALLNGSTNTDRTNYWEVVPTSAVDLCAVDGIRPDGIPPAGGHRRSDSKRSATSS